MNESDITRLLHMLDAAREVELFVGGATRASLDQNQLLVRGLSKSIEIIGEAASKLTLDTRDANPQIPWNQIIGMRNRLTHAYFDISLDRLWLTATVSIPALVLELEKLLPPHASES